MHQQPAYAAYGQGRSFPVAERAAQRVMSLPMSADLSEEQQDRVLSALRQALSETAALAPA
jgi:UDP-2-acetamido-2-deoxy-ribo-hexuluronate aminotransferase